MTKGLSHQAVDQIRDLVNKDHVKGVALREYINTHLDGNCSEEENRQLISDLRNWGHLETATCLENIINSDTPAPAPSAP